MPIFYFKEIAFLPSNRRKVSKRISENIHELYVFNRMRANVFDIAILNNDNNNNNTYNNNKKILIIIIIIIIIITIIMIIIIKK